MPREIAKTERREPMIADTSEFRKALAEKRLAEAEQFLNEVQQNPNRFPKYDARWLDHRQRELFQEYYKIKDWSGAKRIVEVTADPSSKDGRINRLIQLSGMKYEEIT